MINRCHFFRETWLYVILTADTKLTQDISWAKGAFNKSTQYI